MLTNRSRLKVEIVLISGSSGVTFFSPTKDLINQTRTIMLQKMIKISRRDVEEEAEESQQFELYGSCQNTSSH